MKNIIATDIKDRYQTKVQPKGAFDKRKYKTNGPLHKTKTHKKI